MIKQYIWKLIQKIFKYELFTLKQDLINSKCKDKYNDIKKLKEIELQKWVDKPIICISNNITDIVVGFGLYITYLGDNEDPVLMVQDYVSNEILINFSVILPYSEDILSRILDNDLNLTVFLLYKNTSILQVPSLKLDRSSYYRKMYKNGFLEEMHRLYKNGK